MSSATAMESTGTAAEEGPRNPYVGPRPFRVEDLYFGREQEALGLSDSVLAGRVVLLHSPSGAGKTSLLQASVVPALAARRFQICARRKPNLSALRVNAPVPAGGTGNRYVYSVVADLVGGLPVGVAPDEREVRDWTIRRALDALAEVAQAPQRQLIVLDQFEEILTLDPTDQDGQRVFFEQLGEALDADNRWAICAMREDYMGGLDRFLRYVPGQFRSTYRLDLLDLEAALRAIQEPAAARGVHFGDEAAATLIDDLRRVRVQSPEQEVSELKGNYVEPVLLQVACDGLWRKLEEDREEQGGRFGEITTSDVIDFGPLDTALSRYYRLVVRKAAKRDEAEERIIRDWVQDHLLTEAQFRSQTRTRPAVRNPQEVMQYLQRRYLVREDPRPGAVWWELTHDRLIDPVVEDNRLWRDRHLSRWQRDAYEWGRSNRDSRLLLGDRAYRAARSATRRASLTEVEQAFLDESGKAVAHEGKLRRIQSWLGVFQAILVVSVAFNLVLLYLLLR
ncbi:hypothetical protein M6D93_17650 [Jatrophihabitans telluris]|uniref:Novel STAND NTPase 1 domain-containing protein n=1 Tax=Jatrophihabitans telluris TaxID=2038343 RepID=A0ABY4QXU3_9ACTN|nr:hypothetical protein [Jatrophihabitans telluris]UQX88097.1 hypothetical protein M6D93_17650 [Jatrophihabitans telluris]